MRLHCREEEQQMQNLTVARNRSLKLAPWALRPECLECAACLWCTYNVSLICYPHLIIYFQALCDLYHLSITVTVVSHLVLTLYYKNLTPRQCDSPHTSVRLCYINRKLFCWCSSTLQFHVTSCKCNYWVFVQTSFTYRSLLCSLDDHKNFLRTGHNSYAEQQA